MTAVCRFSTLAPQRELLASKVALIWIHGCCNFVHKSTVNKTCYAILIMVWYRQKLCLCLGHVHGSPIHGSPIYGSPIDGSPIYGSPIYGSPIYGSPIYAPPMYMDHPCIWITHIWVTHIWVSHIWVTHIWVTHIWTHPIVCILSDTVPSYISWVTCQHSIIDAKFCDIRLTIAQYEVLRSSTFFHSPKVQFQRCYFK